MAGYILGSELEKEILYRLNLISERLKEKFEQLSDEEIEKTAKAFLLDVIYKHYNVDEINWDSVLDIAVEWHDDLLA